MKVNIYQTYHDMSAATADFVVDVVAKKPTALLCLPSGDTPTKTLQLLVEYSRAKKIDFSKCRFVGLDEWVGMDRTSEGSCQQYIYTNFFDPLKIPQENIVFFNAKAEDLKKECKLVDDFIFKNGPIDLVLVGVGTNGHIGLNEPGASFNWYSHYIELEESTKKAAQKYFSETKTLHQGITLGLRHILDAKITVVIANGLKKAGIIQKIIEGEVTENIPGSVLQRHANCYFFLDKEAGSLLKPS